MALIEDLRRRPIAPELFSVLIGPHAVTLPPGEGLVHIGGWLWTSTHGNPEFGTGRRSCSELNALGDLQERLSSASTFLRRDLSWTITSRAGGATGSRRSSA